MRPVRVPPAPDRRAQIALRREAAAPRRVPPSSWRNSICRPSATMVRAATPSPQGGRPLPPAGALARQPSEALAGASSPPPLLFLSRALSFPALSASAAPWPSRAQPFSLPLGSERERALKAGHQPHFTGWSSGAWTASVTGPRSPNWVAGTR